MIVFDTVESLKSGKYHAATQRTKLNKVTVDCAALEPHKIRQPLIAAVIQREFFVRIWEIY